EQRSTTGRSTALNNYTSRPACPGHTYNTNMATGKHLQHTHHSSHKALDNGLSSPPHDRRNMNSHREGSNTVWEPPPATDKWTDTATQWTLPRRREKSKA
ncbi:Hypothetical predicted protein, partial [Pelobates cultripes]